MSSSSGVSFGSDQGHSYRSALSSADQSSVSLGVGNLKTYQPKVPQPGTKTSKERGNGNGNGNSKVRYDPIKDRNNAAFHKHASSNLNLSTTPCMTNDVGLNGQRHNPGLDGYSSRHAKSREIRWRENTRMLDPQLRTDWKDVRQAHMRF